MVFVMHYLDMQMGDDPKKKYMLFLFNGHDAVSFFFVLSGFVLSYKYIVLDKPLDVNKFYVSRIFRLFPPFFIMLLFDVLFHFRHELNWHTMADVFLFNKTEFWEEAILFKGHNLYYFPGWTLTIELLVSFLMPFFILVAMRHSKLLVYMIIAFLMQGGNFYLHFLLGIILTCNFNKITDPSFRQSAWYRYRYLIIPGAIVLFCVRCIDRVSPFGPTYKYLADFFGMSLFFYTGFAAFILLGAIMISKRTQRILQTRVLVFLGKISYSIYLVHALVLGIVFAYMPALLQGKSRTYTVVVETLVYIAITMVLSTILYYFVERPFMNIGRRISGRMKPSIILQKQPSSPTDQ